MRRTSEEGPQSRMTVQDIQGLDDANFVMDIGSIDGLASDLATPSKPGCTASPLASPVVQVGSS